MNKEIILEQNWDKVFKKNEKVNHKKVTFKNHFGITLAADMYTPKDISTKLPALAISGPFGAVKEQSSGTPRYMNSPDINVEDFQAAVDFLITQENVDEEKIGILGICGWGGIALQTACIDTRVKATITSTMYDMSRIAGNGYFDEQDNEEARYQARIDINKQRTEDFKKQEYKLGGGVVDPLPEDAPWFVKDYYDYYKTKRGYHKRSLNSNNGWNVTANTSLMNTRLFTYANEIRNAVLIIHGEKAHSCYMSKDAFKLLKGNNKELLIIPNAVHTDLYDNMNIIPFDKIEDFLKTNLK